MLECPFNKKSADKSILIGVSSHDGSSQTGRRVWWSNDLCTNPCSPRNVQDSLPHFATLIYRSRVGDYELTIKSRSCLNSGEELSNITTIIEDISNHLPLITHFRARNLSISDAEFSPAFCTALHVREIELFDCCHVNDSVMLTVANHCSLLESLTIMGCPNVSNAGVMAVFDQCHFLTSLDSCDPTAYTDKSLCHLACELESLTVRTNYVSKITRKSVSPHGTKSLEYASNVSVIGRSFGTVFTQCPDLLCIEFSGQDGLTDRKIEELVELCPKLTSLSILDCKCVTSNSLYAVAECADLVSLTLNKISVSDSIFSGLLYHKSNFKKLALPKCTGFTSELVKTITANCPDIRCVDIAHTNCFVYDDIRELLDGCQKLDSLNLHRCAGLTSDIFTDFEGRHFIYLNMKGISDVSKK